MNKKLAAIVLAAVLAGSMIAGCGSSSGGGTASSGSGEPAAAEAEAETGGETEEETQTVDAIDTSAAAVEDVAETAASVEAATTVSEAASTAASSAAETAVETDPVAQAAALIDAIYVQERTETTDADIEAARNAWNALTDEQKALVEGEDADPDYFGRDTGDASLDDPRNGDEIGENELLVVSFGTSFNESRAEDIGGIEKALQEANPDWSVRRAFTAQIIINHVQARDEEVIDNVDQALARAKANGVKNLVVQPTHLMHGAEYDELMAALKAVEGDFETIRVAEPLLGQVGEDASVINEDKAIVAQAVAATAAAEAGYEGEDTAAALAAAAEDGTAFVFMGHGTAHVAKVSYSQMQTQMNELGYNNVFIGTVEGEPEETACDQIIEKVKAAGFKKVILRPLMVVAGDHANNDMAGDEEDSWKSMFMADGSFDQVDCQVEGLGRIPEIQALYAAHTAAALASDPTAGTAVSGAAEDAGAALEDGTYTATFTTDGSMFHVNEAYDNKGTLTVADGQMTIHVSLVSKKIVNLFLGTAEEAQAEGAALLEPTTDSVEYADGTTDEVYGFDIPVPAIGEEFDCALVGEKGKWYDHKVMVTDPVKAE
ncbi:sirohydrochlorin cobaltochelatase [Sarcina sp. DSM 11001]|uniref:sirohydrochlorin cobaltochelatase n=1 Tax=Sarcina sp. DSM 11001 TaxID=1798184 RepID=UPI00325BB7A0